ncbi:GNAT family N-acetyltransferase [Histidinibacterium lentulum]|nr:GNAT family N-acetyltransferase [Histidinibacterium lentulum]
MLHMSTPEPPHRAVSRCEVGPAPLALKPQILAAGAGDPRALEAAFRDGWGRASDSPLLFAATAEGRLLGYIRLSAAARASGAVPRPVRIEEIWVTAEMRGRGLGRLLLAYVLAVSERAGWGALEAEVPGEATGTLRLFRDAGFRERRVVLRLGAPPDRPSAAAWLAHLWQTAPPLPIYAGCGGLLLALLLVLL